MVFFFQVLGFYSIRSGNHEEKKLCLYIYIITTIQNRGFLMKSRFKIFFLFKLFLWITVL